MTFPSGTAFIRKFVDDVRASYWAVPSGFVVMAFLMAMGFSWLDRNPDMLPFQLPAPWVDRQGDGARATLSTIAAAVIGVAGVMFSMTLVAVSFAAGNFGPRLIGNFMRDRGTQVSFGLLMGTFVYALFILRAIQGQAADSSSFVPQYSMVVAILLMVASVFTIIYYVHHVPETINVSNITSDLGHRFGRQIRTMIDERKTMQVAETDIPSGALRTDITLNTSGYIQQMQRDLLFQLARTNDWIIDVQHMPGTFLSPHVPVMQVLSRDGLTDKQIKRLRGTVAVGNSRTEDQATPFIGDKLCEMTARALSPGFNDPFTAINCLNWLHAGLMDAIYYKGGLQPINFQRVRIKLTDFGDLLAPFEKCAPYTITDKMARLHHLDLARSMADHAGADHPQADRLNRLVETLDRASQDISPQ